MADWEPSPYVIAALLQTAPRMQQREFDISLEIRSLHDRMFPSYLDELSSYFLKNFYTTLRDDKQPGWDLVKAKQIGASDELAALTNDFLGVVGDDVDEVLEDSIEEAAEEGFLTGLWLTDMAGVDLNDTSWEFPNFGVLVAAATIDGLTALNRAGGWRANLQKKLLLSFHGLMATQGTLLDTSSITQTLWRSYVSSVAAMATNEVYWGFSVGEQAALQIFAGLVDEVWVTKDDEKVCPQCFRLHLKRTPLLPIRDTHPGCRCSKVPVRVSGGAAPEPVDYDTFVASLRSV